MNLELARWQFALTTAFHFLFVPLSVGLSLLVAVFQTMWRRTGNDTYRRMTRFWGKIFLVSFALGVVTGIVLEFQFGMNWSAYSRFVGDVFGAPLAMEGLLAFFLESTFLGLWIFGWDRLPPRVHLASIWLVSLGTVVSATFILAANAWMQHPVGHGIDAATGRAVLTDLLALVTSSTFLLMFAHVVLGAFITGGMFVVGVSAFHLLRRAGSDVFVRSIRIALVFTFASSVAVAFVGHAQAQLVAKQQPMKMAAADAAWTTRDGASFSLLTIGNLQDPHPQPVFEIRIPHLLSVLATNTWNGRVQGIVDLQRQYAATYGDASYVPVLWMTYWSFRAMVGAGTLLILLTAVGLWRIRRGRLETDRRYLRLCLWAIALPFAANTAGWVFTEVGRQPWVVQGLMRTDQAVSPSVGTGFVVATLVGFVGAYAFLAVVGASLTVRLIRRGPEEAETEERSGSGADPTLVY